MRPPVMLVAEAPFPKSRNGVALSQKLKRAIELLGYFADIVGRISEVCFIRAPVGQRGETLLGMG